MIGVSDGINDCQNECSTCFNILSNYMYSLPAITVICRRPRSTVASNLGVGGSLLILVFPLVGIDVIIFVVVLKRPLFTRGCDDDGPCGRR